jgi:hypothetical protein
MAKDRNLGQEKGQQGFQDDRSDRESGQPLQLDDEKMKEKPGGQHAQGQKPQQGGQQPQPQQGGQQPQQGKPHEGGNR